MADIETLASLANRLEYAGPKRQAGLLWELWGLTDWSNDYANFINCGAYLSAAEMLVGDYTKVTMSHEPNVGFALAGYAQARIYDGEYGYHVGEAVTMPCALAVACLRASITRKETR